MTGCAGGRLPEQPAAGGAVQQQAVAVPGVPDRQDHRHPVPDHADVRDQPGVEHLVQHPALVHLAVRQPGHPGAVAGRQQVHAAHHRVRVDPPVQSTGPETTVRSWPQTGGFTRS